MWSLNIFLFTLLCSKYRPIEDESIPWLHSSKEFNKLIYNATNKNEKQNLMNRRPSIDRYKSGKYANLALSEWPIQINLQRYA